MKSERMIMIEEKIATLEKLCPGVNINPILTDNVINFLAPTTGGRIGKFTVDLNKIGMTFEEWLDDSISQYQPTDRDTAYNVICDECGKVQIGYRGYLSQISLANSRWVCPKCGDFAEFDDDSYEEFYDN